MHNAAHARGKWSASTEQRLLSLLTAARIAPRESHATDLPGTPDFVYRRERVAIFTNGCFWHGCPLHWKPSSTRARFWWQKVFGNRLRDEMSDRALAAAGWLVVRIWEHELRNDGSRLYVVARVEAALRGEVLPRDVDPEGTRATCRFGHPLTPDNARRYVWRARRLFVVCRTCRRLQMRRARTKRNPRRFLACGDSPARVVRGRCPKGHLTWGDRPCEACARGPLVRVRCERGHILRPGRECVGCTKPQGRKNATRDAKGRFSK